MFSDILQKLEQERLRKIALKLPLWGEKALEVPDELAFQQCSSQLAASFKASLLKERFGSGLRLADLTGGLGVDSSAFASVCSAVLYNERNGALAQAAGRNFERLGLENISVCNRDITVGNALNGMGLSSNQDGPAPGSDTWMEAVHTFAPDVIYADPARRDAGGKKVFLPEDCSPDITRIIPLFPDCRFMVKLSPVADISLLRKRLPSLKEIHIVSIGAEVKELLCLSSGCESLYVDFPESGISRRLYPFEATDCGGTQDAQNTGETPFTRLSYGSPPAGGFLFEPSAALLKSGFQDRFCLSSGLKLKADPFTHLYFSEVPMASIAPDWGKRFRIIEVTAFSKNSIKAIAGKYPKAELTAKNLPLTTDQLRKKMKLSSSGPVHIFAFKSLSSNLLAVTEPV